MKDLQYYYNLIVKDLDIEGMLEICGDHIKPSKKLNKKYIKETHTDDLFQIHNRDVVFTNRFRHLVSEITNRKLYTGHYLLCIREVK